MKAVEYHEKYSEQIRDAMLNKLEPEDEMTLLYMIFLDFSEEGRALIEKRRAQTEEAISSIIRELNDKWNSLGRLISKSYNGQLFLRPNGFSDFWGPKIKEYQGVSFMKNAREAQERTILHGGIK